MQVIEMRVSSCKKSKSKSVKEGILRPGGGVHPP
jgi:hypothetical protein